MKLVARTLAALAVLALASPALACDGAHQTTTAQAKDTKAAPKAAAKASAKQKTQKASDKATAQVPVAQPSAQN
jgi:hypothetical protein